MGNRRLKPATRPWVEWHARRIDDPVARLRYLKAAAPPMQTPAGDPAWKRRLAAFLLVMTAGFFLVRARVRVEPLPSFARHIRPPVSLNDGLPDVWQVEKGRDFEVYSNGLRIDNRFVVGTHSRSYHVFPVERPPEAGESKRTQPAGIVFHTTESLQVRFEAAENRTLKAIGENLLEYVRRHHSYNFVIDRFGRVHRIVPEDEVAEHAGFSIWADGEWYYLNLNESFLGISFEAKTDGGDEEPELSPGQGRAAAMLIEMLRSRYSIPARDCVTHAQVSVNPANMRVGYHTDWGSSFPFEGVGLPNNYTQPIPAIAAFGFEADDIFQRVAGTRLYEGVQLAEEAFRAQAALHGVEAPAFKRMLQGLYRQKLGLVRGAREVAERAE